MVKTDNKSENKHKMITRSKNKFTKSNKKTSNSDSDDEDLLDINQEEFQKLLYSMFPSNYLKNKIENNENSKENIENKKSIKKNKKNNKHEDEDKDEENVNEEEDEEESINSEDTESESEYEMEDDEDGEISPKIAKFDIIFTFKNDDYEDEEYEDEDEDEDEDYEESIDEDYSSEDEEYEQQEENEEVIENKKKNKISYSENKETLNEFKTLCKSFMDKNKENPIAKDLEKQTKEIEKKIKKEENKKNKKQIMNNCKKFSKLLTSKNMMNDYKFFKDKLDIEDQNKIIKELEEVGKLTTISKPYKLKLLEAPIPQTYKAAALKKINTLKQIHSGGGEYYKIKNWIDSFLQIPFNKNKNLPVSIEDGMEACNIFMENAEKKLNEAIYGMNDAKIQIMQMIGQWIANPDSVGNAIALKGPMGTGKTTLIKEGVSKILGRDFAFIPLGGATDSSFLEGHSYTYEGSTYGKIVDILIQTQSSNPIIYFDELDKVSDTPKGEEIIGILTHLTDTSQNSQFHDKYFSEIDFDLSKCLFIFSYNDEYKVSPILRDRMYVIESKGYDVSEKEIITKNYLVPSVERLLKLNNNDIIFEEGVINYMIKEFTSEEKGVRNLKRCIEIIYTKLNLYRMMRPGSKLFDEEIISDIVFPFKVTKEHVNKLIKKTKDENNCSLPMYL